MWKGLFAGALALATAGTSLAPGTEFERNAATRARAHHSGVVLSVGRIAHVKSMLKLTPEQERHWAPFEAALRDYLRRHGATEVEPTQLHRLGSAAMPLLMSLDEGQKAQALRVARSMGLGKIVAMF